MGRTY